MCIEIEAKGKKKFDEYLIDNNYNVNDFVNRYNKNEISKELNEDLKDMRNNDERIKIIKPYFKNFVMTDKERKFPIYSYKKSDIEIYKKHLEDLKNKNIQINKKSNYKKENKFSFSKFFFLIPIAFIFYTYNYSINDDTKKRNLKNEIQIKKGK